MSDGHVWRRPRPKTANRIARETGKPVLASDDRIYTGATVAEVEAYKRRRDAVYGGIDAIKELAGLARAQSPDQWLDSAERWWLRDLKSDDILAAINWLRALAAAQEEGKPR